MNFLQDRQTGYGRLVRPLVCWITILTVILASVLTTSAHNPTHSPFAVSASLADAGQPDDTGGPAGTYSDHCCYHFGAILPHSPAVSEPVVMTAAADARPAALSPISPPAPHRPPRA